MTSEQSVRKLSKTVKTKEECSEITVQRLVSRMEEGALLGSARWAEGAV